MDTAVLNILSTLLNVWLTFKIKNIQVNKELIADLREANDDKDKVIHDLHQKLNQYKIHNAHLVGESRKKG